MAWYIFPGGVYLGFILRVESIGRAFSSSKYILELLSDKKGNVVYGQTRSGRGKYCALLIWQRLYIHTSTCTLVNKSFFVVSKKAKSVESKRVVLRHIVAHLVHPCMWCPNKWNLNLKDLDSKDTIQKIQIILNFYVDLSRFRSIFGLGSSTVNF